MDNSDNNTKLWKDLIVVNGEVVNLEYNVWYDRGNGHHELYYPVVNPAEKRDAVCAVVHKYGLAEDWYAWAVYHVLHPARMLDCGVVHGAELAKEKAIKFIGGLGR